MHKKFILSFSILMISSCLVQIASADKKENRVLKKVESVGNGKEVPKGFVLITTSLSNNIVVGDGSIEIVENGKTSVGATLKKGGMQIVTRKGNAINAKILGGKQFVYEEKSFDLTSVERKSGAYDTTVSGDDGVVGQQNVYDGAWVWNTKITKNGEQNLYAGQRRDGGKAKDAEISENGRQHVLAQGEAFNTTLKDQAMQIVYPKGFIDTLTIKDTASSWFYSGMKEVAGEVRVNDNGKLYLFAGDVTNQIKKEKISIEGRVAEILFEVGERNIAERSHINIKNLGGEGGTVIFTSIPYDPRHISLYVDELSGNLHFQFNISTRNDRSDYLSIGNGTGNHTINVSDSGREITNSLSQEKSLVTAIKLITDRSPNGGANFTLANSYGTAIEAVDGGAYMYHLNKKERIADSSGDYTIWYLSIGTENSDRPLILPLRTNRRQKVAVFSRSPSSEENTRSQQRFSSSRKQGSHSQTTTYGQKSEPKSRPPRHLKEVHHVSIPSTVSSSQDQRSSLVGQDHLFDEQQRPVVSLDSSLLVDQIILHPSDQEQLFLQSHKEMLLPHFLTTPSTDAVLSMAVIPGLVFQNELRAVYAGRGILDRNKKNAAFWTYAIKSKENITRGHIDFKLEQTGIVLGISGLNELMYGDVYIGGFGSYDQTHVVHARGGVSGINTYSVGAYATYFHHNGWYLDGILKYNRYHNTLNAISTNGLAIEGNYKQGAVGLSFEAGYRIKTSRNSWLQPYTQFTWLQVEGKEIKLSNGMIGNISPFTSLHSEVGLSLGYEFGLGTAFSSLAYITVAWLRENKDNNHTTINHLHQFTTDLSGNTGKLGIGLSSFVSDKLKFYVQAHYIKGHKTKQSLQGILGVRYNF